jgi:hypothetical protein
MNRFKTATLGVAGLLAAWPSLVRAAVSVPFTENYATNASGWVTALNAAPTYVATGGPNGAGDSYISSLHTLTSATGASTIFRGNDSNDASGDGFVGNWVSAGLTQLSFWIRHNSAIDLTVGARMATSANSPAFAITSPVKVVPNTWTLVTFDIAPGNAALTPEGPVAFNDVYTALGNIQLLASRETLAAGTPVTFDIDKVSVTPEPASVALLALGSLVTQRRKRVAR